MIGKKIFGEEHSSVATSHKQLGRSVLVVLGEYNQAKELQEKALMIGKKIFRRRAFKSVATSHNNLALRVRDALGEYNQAKELHEKALMIRKKIFGEEHSSVATSYNNLALVYDMHWRIQSSQRTSRKGTDDSEKDFQRRAFDPSQQAITTWQQCTTGIGEYNQAKKLYKKALMIMKKIFGEEHSDVATSYNNLAGPCTICIGEYNQAKELNEKALMIRKKVFGEEHSRRRNKL